MDMSKYSQTQPLAALASNNSGNGKITYGDRTKYCFLQRNYQSLSVATERWGHHSTDKLVVDSNDDPTMDCNDDGHDSIDDSGNGEAHS